MTLFGVGFNVSVKAEDPPVPTGPYIEVVPNSDGSIEWKLTLYNDKQKTSFPSVFDGKYTYTYTFEGVPGDDNKYNLDVYTRNEGGDLSPWVKFSNGTEKKWSELKFPYSIHRMEKDDVKKQLEPSGAEGEQTFHFSIKEESRSSSGAGVGDAPESSYAGRNIYSYQVNLKPKVSDLDIKYDVTDGYLFLLPKETSTITASTGSIPKNQAIEADGQESAFRWARWEANNLNVSLKDIKSTDETKSSVEVTMIEGPKGATDINPMIGTVTMKFNPDITAETVELNPGDTLDERDITVTSNGCEPYTKDDVKSVTINGKEVKNLKWSGGKFGFTVDPDTPPGTNGSSSLSIEMKDGNTFHRSLKITTPEITTVTVSTTGGGTAKAIVEHTKTQKKDEGSTVVAEEGDIVTISAKANTGYSFIEWELISGEAKFDEASETATFVMGDESVSIEANFAKKSTITFKPIKVTKGKSVKMSDFVTPKTAKLTVTSLDESIVTVDPDGDPEEVSNIEVTGVEPTSTSGVEAIQIATSTAEKNVNVTVYNTPKLSVNKTASSSAPGLTVTMPSAVYYNSTGSLTDYEPENFTVVYTHGNEEEKEEDISSISIKSFSKSMKELLDDDDEGKVEVIVYPVNPKTEKTDSNVKSNKVEIKVYKIKLDGSSGANYKVNEKDIDDGYFYAIEDVDYKITATNKSGYTSTIERWEGVDFGSNTGGTKSFDDTKTIKAVFKSSSTFIPSGSTMLPYASSSMSSRTTATGGSGSGTSGGDYDDVPKTGESKTDIWILWSVLLASILGAGFMIYKRFGIVRAIAEADRQEAEAVQQEMLRKKEKDKENMIDTIKGLRKL